MPRFKRVLPIMSGTILIILYCLWTYWIVDAYLPVWSTVGLGLAGMMILIWRAGRMDTIEGGWYGLTRGTLVTLPAVGALIAYSGIGGMLRASLDAFSGDPMAGTAPGTRFTDRAATIMPESVTVPYSLFFTDQLTGEISTAETYFALVVFDPIYLLIAVESTALFVIGCVVGSLCYKVATGTTWQ